MNFGEINTVDLIVMLVVGSSVLVAFWCGIISSVLSLVRTILSIIGAFYMRDTVMPLFVGLTDNAMVQNYLAYISSFLLLMITLSFVRHWLTTLLKKVFPGSLDRILGAFFGLARAMLIISFVFVFWSSANGGIKITRDERHKVKIVTNEKNLLPALAEAKSLNFLISSSEIFLSILPSDLWQGLHEDFGILPGIDGKTSSKKTKDYGSAKLAGNEKVSDLILNKYINDFTDGKFDDLPEEKRGKIIDLVKDVFNKDDGTNYSDKLTNLKQEIAEVLKEESPTVQQEAASAANEATKESAIQHLEIREESEALRSQSLETEDLPSTSYHEETNKTVDPIDQEALEKLFNDLKKH